MAVYGTRLDKLAWVIGPDGSRETFERDAEARLLTHTDALNRQTRYSYTAAGLISKRTNARGDSLEYAWNRLGQLVALRNENGAEYRFGYDAAGQLTQIADMRRGEIQYAYDPIGRLTRAQSSLGVETFAFDPASNIVEATERDVHGIGVLGGEPAVPLLDNLLKEYAGTHNTYDEQGNLKERRRNGERMVFGWSSLGRMVTASDRHMQAKYAYDALGRRIAKLTEPQVPHLSSAGSGWRDAERRRLKQEHGYGLTLYGWDGDTLAYETSWDKRETTHYVYEPGGFTPLVRATGAAVLRDDESAAAELTSIAYYHCDQIGTPQEVTDEAGEIAWSARYKAWGEAREVIGEAARKAGIVNPLRFAGQYFDRETGLHYNRYRYYDPSSGRFVSKDPIGLQGGLNAFQYALNPISWIDPLGLMGYRVATRTAQQVELGRDLSDKQAISRVQRGGDVHAENRSDAISLGKRCACGKLMKHDAHPDRVTGSTEGRLPHVHPNNHEGVSGDAHIFYPKK
ncbi:RHS repeat-associated core domain-containing protein [Burkholderia stagnalis]|uniref:RHS repeat-associated core domain-containing protein n=4 Tax=Burkholderia stagnalis TaxID=1503054 RepID=UPI000841719E|nr:RHS repeat-associated core domain-containing protein [Burkholderia stagnalis]AOK56975.1 hypothetical protein WT74_30555 [Burkholderia stagnalis]